MEGPCSSRQGSWECQGMASSLRSVYPLSCQPVQPRTQRDTLCTWQWQGSILRGAMDVGRGRSGRLGATLIPFRPITNKHTVEVKKKSVLRFKCNFNASLPAYHPFPTKLLSRVLPTQRDWRRHCQGAWVSRPSPQSRSKSDPLLCRVSEISHRQQGRISDFAGLEINYWLSKQTPNLDIDRP